MTEPTPLLIRKAMLDLLRGITKDNGYRTDIGKTVPIDGFPPPTGVTKLDLSDFEETSDGLNGCDKYRCGAVFTASADVLGWEESDYVEAHHIQSDVKKALKAYVPPQGLMVGCPSYKSSQVGKARDAEGVSLLIVDVSFTIRYDDPAE